MIGESWLNYLVENKTILSWSGLGCSTENTAFLRLKDGSVEFEMVWDSEDDDFTSIRDAFLNKTALELAVMDGDITVADTQGLRASFMVTSFSRNEPLEEAITASVTVKPTYSTNPPTWMTVP